MLHVARDVLEHHDRVVDNESHAKRQRHQRQVVEAVAEEVHQSERADDRQRQRKARNNRGRRAAQEDEDHGDNEKQRDQQRELHVAHRIADRLRAVVENRQVYRRRKLRLKRRQDRADRVDDFDRVRAGLPLHGEHDATRAVVPGGDFVVLHAVEHAANLGKAHRRAVPIGDDHRCIGFRVDELARGHHRCRAVAAVKRSSRQIDIGVADGLFDVGQRDSARSERIRVELDAHRVLLRPEYLNLCHAVDRRDPLRQIVLGVLVD